MKKGAKIFLIVFIISLVTFIGGGIIIGLVYEDEIKASIKEELNQYLDAEVKVGAVEFSFFRKLPYASLIFNDVVVHNPKQFSENQDTVYCFDKVYVKLNLFQLIRHNYSIEELEFSDGMVNIKRNSQGVYNYKVWKTQEKKEASDTVDFSINFKKLLFTNCQLNYYDVIKDVNIQTLIHSSYLRGNFSKEQYNLSLNSSNFIQNIEIQNTNYAKNVESEHQINIYVADNQYTINKSFLKVGRFEFDVDGEFESLPKSKDIDINLKARNLDIRSILSILPPETKQKLHGIKSNGVFYLNINAIGELSKTQDPHVIGSFGIQNGSISYADKDITISGIEATGSFSNGEFNSIKSTSLELKSFTGLIEGQLVELSGSIVNFVKPKLNIHFISDFEPILLNQFIEKELLLFETGIIESDIKAKGKLPGWKNLELKDFKNFDISGTCHLSGVNLVIKDKNRLIDVTGEIEFKEKLHIKDFKILYNNDLHSFSGSISNLLPFLISEEEYLSISLDHSATGFNLSNYLNNDDESSDIQSDSVVRDYKIKTYINTHLDAFEYGKIKAEDVKGIVRYRPGRVIFDVQAGMFMNGNIKTNGKILFSKENEMILTCKSNLSKVDISTVFESFDNFGQDVVTSNHLKGEFTGHVNFSSKWDEEMKLKKEDLLAECNFIIRNGELIDFKPLYGLSKYYDLEELKDIKFSQIENEIIIKDESLIIPEMEIQSNAFNISGSGVHHFDNSYDYKLKIWLSDILFKKAKKKKSEIEEYVVIEDKNKNRNTVYLNITGKDEQFKVKYDTKSAREKIRKDLKEEKQELKSILKEEFGLFSKDTSIVKEEKDPENTTFQIKWEEEEENQNSPEKEKKDIKKDTNKKKFKIEWDSD